MLLFRDKSSAAPPDLRHCPLQLPCRNHPTRIGVDTALDRVHLPDAGMHAHSVFNGIDRPACRARTPGFRSPVGTANRAAAAACMPAPARGRAQRPAGDPDRQAAEPGRVPGPPMRVRHDRCGRLRHRSTLPGWPDWLALRAHPVRSPTEPTAVTTEPGSVRALNSLPSRPNQFSPPTQLTAVATEPGSVAD